MKRIRKYLAALASLSLVGLVVLPGAAGADSILTDAGPLTDITISPDLNCSVNHTGDTDGEWFNDTACGTFVSVDGVLYGPASIPAGGNVTGVSGYTPFTPVSQNSTGLSVVTVVALGTTGLQVTETDTYVPGQESYRTDITLGGATTLTRAIIYHGGDCFLQNSDTGAGRIDNGSDPVCVAVPGSTGGGDGAGVARRAATPAAATDPTRIEGLYPITPGNRYIESFYADMWAAIGSQAPLPNTCVCTGDPIDNAIAVSWNETLAANLPASVSLLTTFSPTGASPIVFSKTANDGEVDTGDGDGYEIRISNSGQLPQTLTSVTDTLPAGFTYTPGSSRGITSSDPTIDGNTLTWTGSFVVPNTDGSPGPLSLDFDVTVSDTPGTYTNSVTGAGPGVSVVPANNVAPITVDAPVVTPPTATDDSYSTPFDTELSVDAPGVLGNDTSPRVEPQKQVVTSSVTQPSHGTLSINSDGSFTYTPTSGFSGDDTFTYAMTDGTAESNTATVTVAVGAAPTPSAKDDSYSTDEDTTLDGSSVLANDSNPSGGTFTAVLQTGPSHGTLNLHSDGTFVYTPASNYNGSDTFTYKASDGMHTSDAATVTITVNPVNDPIVAHDDSYTVQQDTTLTVQAPGVLGNDDDPDGRASASVVDNPTHGSLTLNANGGFSYTPTSGFTGDDSFTYSAGDGSQAKVTITVTRVDHAPSASDDSYSTDEGHTLDVAAPGVLSNDSDPDGDSLTATDISTPSHGTLTAHSDGSFSYVPDTNFSGTDTFTYKARAGELTSSTATVTITVNAVDHAPVALGNTYSTPQDTTLAVAAPGVLGNDSDPDGDTITADLVSTTSHGTLTLGSDGAVTYVPDTGFTGADTFTYRALDPSGKHSRTVTVTISVTAANHPPTAVADAYSVDQDTTLAVGAITGVLHNDSDPDGDALTTHLITTTAHGTLTLRANGGFVYVPDAGFVGSDVFRYRAVDPSGAESSGVDVTITVRPVDHAPTAATDSYETPQDTTLDVDAARGVLVNDTDPEGDPLTVGLSTSPDHGTLVLDPDGAFRYTPSTGFSGTDTFTYAASDGTLTSPLTLVTITVDAVTPTPTPTHHPHHPSTTPTPTPTPTPAPTGPVDTQPVLPVLPQPATDAPSAPTTPITSAPTTPSPTPSRNVDAVTLAQLPIGVLSVNPGGTLNIHGSGCPAGSPVVLSFDGQRLGTTTADGNGHFASMVTAPRKVGTFRVTARCGDLLLAGRVALVAVTSNSASPGAQAITVSAVLSFFLLLLGLTLRRPMFRATKP